MDARARAFALVRKYGRDTVSFQGLESDFRYFFDGDDAMVSFVDTGGSWVGAGGPVAPPGRELAVATAFADAAGSQGKRACFFAAERTLAEAGVPSLQIGEQPVWECARWDEVLASAKSLRYQLARAHNKGVTVRRIDGAELAPGLPLRAAVDELGRHWQAAHRMPPMRFLVQLEPLSWPDQRVIHVAEKDGALVGLASAVPVYARRRLFLEDFVRAPGAPNGTIELLVDAAMRASPHELTLGLAPLAGEVARWLRFARWAGGRFYDFEGLHRFKAKLRPHSWEPVFLCLAPGGSRITAMRDSLRAFAGGSLVGFATRTLLRR